jgi:hypothetical protein
MVKFLITLLVSNLAQLFLEIILKEKPHSFYPHLSTV